MKVLKSFKTAHDAINWMSQNRIEDTSVEMTSSLKSLGHQGAVPAGNYHVVLKSDVAETTSADGTRRVVGRGDTPEEQDADLAARDEAAARYLASKAPHRGEVAPSLDRMRPAYKEDYIRDLGDRKLPTEAINAEHLYSPAATRLHPGNLDAIQARVGDLTSPEAEEFAEKITKMGTPQPTLMQKLRGLFGGGPEIRDDARPMGGQLISDAKRQAKTASIKSIVEEAVYEVLKGIEIQQRKETNTKLASIANQLSDEFRMKALESIVKKAVMDVLKDIGSDSPMGPRFAPPSNRTGGYMGRGSRADALADFEADKEYRREQGRSRAGEEVEEGKEGEE